MRDEGDQKEARKSYHKSAHELDSNIKTLKSNIRENTIRGEKKKKTKKHSKSNFFYKKIKNKSNEINKRPTSSPPLSLHAIF